MFATQSFKKPTQQSPPRESLAKKVRFEQPVESYYTPQPDLIDKGKEIKMGAAGKLRLVNPQFVSQYSLDYTRNRYAICMEL